MKLLLGALSLLGWVEIFLVAFAGFIMQVPLAILSYPFDRQRRLPGRWYRRTAVVAATLSPFWRLRVHGSFPRRITRPTVVVSNHCSHLDSFLISHLPWEMKWLGKASLWRIPFVGWSMFLSGDIPVDRGVPASVARAMRRCKDYIAHGMPVFMFPEGTRSPSDTLLPFKDGAFRLAIETGADVLPLAVAGTRAGLRKNSWRFDFTRACVTVGTPISTAGLTLADLETLKNSTRQAIDDMARQLRALSTAAASSSVHTVA